MEIRATETNAPATLAGLIPELTKLTMEQPTTAEIEEAHKVAKAITRLLVEWLADRYYTKAQVNGNTALRQIAAEQFTEEDFSLNPEQEAAFEKLAQETAQIREAARAESLKPEVFDIVGWTQNYFKPGA